MNHLNRQRAQRAANALKVSREASGAGSLEEAIIDLIANLGHFAEHYRMDYAQLAVTAIGHWKAEQAQPDGGGLAPAVTITIDNESHPQ